jgi:hypothetical protein
MAGFDAPIGGGFWAPTDSDASEDAFAAMRAIAKCAAIAATKMIPPTQQLMAWNT